MSETGAVLTVSVVIGVLLAETRFSRAQERALRARGAIEPAGDPYLALAIIYPLAFLAMGAEGLWRTSVAVPISAGNDFIQPSWMASGVLLFTAAKALKYWAIAHLGDRWTFRILVVPGAPLVGTGPYRYVRHPNYVAVFGELVGMALMMTAWVTGPLATIAFAVALRRRLRVEEAALSEMTRSQA